MSREPGPERRAHPIGAWLHAWSGSDAWLDGFGCASGSLGVLVSDVAYNLYYVKTRMSK